MKPENYADAFYTFYVKNIEYVQKSFDKYQFGAEKKYTPLLEFDVGVDEDANTLVFNVDGVIHIVDIARITCFEMSNNEAESIVGIATPTFELYLRVLN